MVGRNQNHNSPLRYLFTAGCRHGSAWSRCFLPLLVCIICVMKVHANDKWPHDSARITHKIERNWPVVTKANYRRFYRLYKDKNHFERLIKGRDTAWVRSLLQDGRFMNRDLFNLTFNNMSGDDFSFAVLYPLQFSKIKCKDDEWYLSQFAIIYNTSGEAVKLFDHLARGHSLFSKSSMQRD